MKQVTNNDDYQEVVEESDKARTKLSAITLGRFECSGSPIR